MIAVLDDRRLPEGGFAARPGGVYRCDATAWAVLALRAHGEPPGTLEPSRALLAAGQASDGSLPIDSGHPEAVWPTPLATLAWSDDASSEEARRRAIDYLLQSRGLHFEAPEGSPLGHDPLIPGWAWTLGAHSFVEPTVLSLLALAQAGYQEHERSRLGAAMLLNRQLSRGGWNYGNTTVFGQELEALPSTAGMALTALAGRVEPAQVEGSLDYMRSEAERVRTPLSLGWALAALDAFGQRPPEAAEWIEQTTARQAVVGPFDTSELSLLLIASAPVADRRAVLGVLA